MQNIDRGSSIPPCKIDSRKNIGAFHASRTNIEILSCSRKNQGDHVSRRYNERIHGLIFSHSLTCSGCYWHSEVLLLKGFTGKMMFYLFKSLQNPQTALKIKTYVHWTLKWDWAEMYSLKRHDSRITSNSTLPSRWRKKISSSTITNNHEEIQF